MLNRRMSITVVTASLALAAILDKSLLLDACKFQEPGTASIQHLVGAGCVG